MLDSRKGGCMLCILLCQDRRLSRVSRGSGKCFCSASRRYLHTFATPGAAQEGERIAVGREGKFSVAACTCIRLHTILLTSLSASCWYVHIAATSGAAIIMGTRGRSSEEGGGGEFAACIRVHTSHKSTNFSPCILHTDNMYISPRRQERQSSGGGE